MLNNGSINDANQFDSAPAASTAGWWAVYTRHQHEKSVAEMLTAKGFDVYLPLYESVRRWKDRNKKLLMPLFPCYLFVREQLGGRLQIMTTAGTHNILTRGERLAVISDEEIQSISRAAEDPSRIEPYPFLHLGERVRVKCGTLQGIEGILIRKKNLCRLVISVQMLAQSASVEISASDVEPVASSQNPDHGLQEKAAWERLTNTP
ncbi:MAG TPA: UpxY family transcription antiterminator [Terracidiphilus sp.]|nr:UpxY family transcription antiterminator [Terracidiphilus sp.]